MWYIFAFLTVRIAFLCTIYGLDYGINLQEKKHYFFIIFTALEIVAM